MKRVIIVAKEFGNAVQNAESIKKLEADLHKNGVGNIKTLEDIGILYGEYDGALAPLQRLDNVEAVEWERTDIKPLTP